MRMNPIGKLKFFNMKYTKYRSMSNSVAPSFDVKRLLLPLAKQFNRTNKTFPFEGVLLTGVQHMLATTVDMFSVLKANGLQDAIVTGKSYSTHFPSVKEFQQLGYTFIPASEQLGYAHFTESLRDATCQVWAEALQKIKYKKFDLLIGLDDGADLLLTTHPKLFNGLFNKPEAIIGIEQTRGGSNRSSFFGLPFPVINVAGSCIKNLIEYPEVAKVIVGKVQALSKQEVEPHLLRKPVIGVIGNGHLGKCVAEQLSENGNTVIVYDKNKHRYFSNPKVFYYPDPALLIMSADIIISCTGKDVTAYNNSLQGFLYSPQKKWLVSAGSKDIEFNRFLELIQNETKVPGRTPDPLRDIRYKNRLGVEVILCRGGFPINFDNQGHSVPPQHIWTTRALLLLACSMCSNLWNTKHFALQTANILKLDAFGQLAILQAYQIENPTTTCLKDLEKLKLRDILEFIKANSEGEEIIWEYKNHFDTKLDGENYYPFSLTR